MQKIAHYHLPGLFEFYDFYAAFLPVYRENRNWFYDWCDIASLYGAPADCLWGGGRVGSGDRRPEEVFALAAEYSISPRLTFSNSLLGREHLGGRQVQRSLRPLRTIWRRGHSGLGPAAGIPAKERSEALFRVLYYQGPDPVCGFKSGTGTAGIFLRYPGFPTES